MIVAPHQKALDEALKISANRNITADMMLREGNPADIIDLTAKQKTSGIIIIGSHGLTGMKRLLMGSVAKRVIGNAPCPVLVVRY
jgi:nucleotide-binding universal stress UspA family protein